MADVDTEQRSRDMGMHSELLTGRTQQRFFSAEEDERFLYPAAFEVDFDQRAEFDAQEMEISAVNLKIRELMQQGFGHIVVKNPNAKHSLATTLCALETFE